MNRPNADHTDDGLFIAAGIMVLAMVAIPAVYAAHAGGINGFLLALGKAQLRPFLPFSQEAQTTWHQLCWLDPQAVTWDAVEQVLYATGTWIRWPLALILFLLGGVAVSMGRTGKLVRRFTMDTLLANNAESFSCLRPIVGRGKELLNPASYDKGLWMVARTPLQFALEHGLLVNATGEAFTSGEAMKNGMAVAGSAAFGKGYLDESKIVAVLTEQLGNAWNGFASLTPCRKALATALISYAHGDRKGAIAILDEVACSYQETKGMASCPVLESNEFATRIRETWNRHGVILQEACMVRHAAFELPWFMALLYRARRKGVLACSQFLWLRPMDRPLWYALNQCGGRTAWAEGFAPWAHYMAEERAGHALAEPQVAYGVASIRNALDEQGWLADRQYLVATPPASEEPDRVYAEAEADPESLYDAETDPSLKAQQL